MRARHLSLTNVRGFESLELDFDPRLTVLVGANGSGKTTVLEAVVALSSAATGSFMHAEPTWLSNGRQTFRSELRIETARDEQTFSIEFTWPGSMPHVSKPLLSKEELATGPIPITFFIGVDRSVLDSTPDGTATTVWRPRDALQRKFESRPDFAPLFAWFREREDLENEQRVRSHAQLDPQLDAVRSAIEAVLPGFRHPHVRRPRNTPDEAAIFRRATLSIEKDGATFAFNQLSEGERCLAAMAADIARRLAIANPEVADPLAGEGIVMIDEIELHLHPKWQAEILDRLLATFPNLQFIVTTHSPLVLRHVPAQQIRILEGFEVYSPAHPVEGRDAGSILSDVFDIDPLPQETREAVDHISGLIDADRFEDARAELQRLSDKLGNLDVEVTRLRTALDLMAS